MVKWKVLVAVFPANPPTVFAPSVQWNADLMI
jgi:hypothetical protein